MIASDFVVQIAEATLDRVGAGTIGRQKQQLKAGMLPQPALDEGGFMDFTVVSHEVDTVKAPGRIGAVEEIQPVQKQSRHLPKPKARMYSARAQIQSPGPR